ncbi:hypothetical protein [Nocardia crassostreae]|uniref:hypothetical protein n=1 Tax=Nocardia crassostreae TaxID=53428 RepID=UPI000A94B74E|nr:hypothetical protein [Nocardia crassostreae]
MPNRQTLPAWTPGSIRPSGQADSDGKTQVFNFNNMTQERAAQLAKRARRSQDVKNTFRPASKA